MDPVRKAAQEYANVFGVAPTAYGCAPGRVEVLGNHTDYNEGFILSAAIDRHVTVVGRAIPGETAKVYSATFQAGETFAMSHQERSEQNPWINYVAGVVEVLREAGVGIGAFEALVDSDVPLGSGLSSSAALEVATARFLQALYPFPLDPIPLALTCQKAENQFVGVQCGILDQFSSCMGKADHLIFLDCRDLDKYDHFPLGEDARLVLAHTHASHSLADGTYNRLREDCFRAAAHFADKLSHPVTHLRDVTEEEFEAEGGDLPEETRKRAKHIVTENARVLRAVDALKAGDLATMGECMFGSHASSRHDFGNSCAELDAMVDAAHGMDGCFGARLSGGGFGGCTVNLVRADRAEDFARELAEAYEKATGLHPDMHLCRAVDGARGGTL